MKLRFKLIIMVVFLSLFYFLFSIVLILSTQLTSNFVENSELLSRNIHEEMSQTTIKYGRYYYGRSNRPLINSIYSIHNIMEQGQTIQATMQIPNGNWNWNMRNVSDLSILRDEYPDQYQQLLEQQVYVNLINSYIEMQMFDSLCILCSTGIGLHFGKHNESVLNWYNSQIDQCESQFDCSKLINEIDNEIIIPTLDFENEIWQIRSNKCMLYAKKARKLNLGVTNPQINTLLYTKNKMFLVIDQTMEETDFETGLMIWENQSESTMEQIYQNSIHEMKNQKFKLEYEGMSVQRVLLFTSYYFPDQFYNYTTDISIDRQKQASLIYMQSSTKKYYNDQAGNNLQGSQFNIQLLICGIAIYIVIIMYVWRRGVIIAYSLEVPIESIIELIRVDMKYLETSTFSRDSYITCFNNYEVYKLCKVLINYLNNIKYSNNKLFLSEFDEAEQLIILSMSKQFYKKYNNMAAVGICSNNIAKIHMRHKRYLEAMNEQEESVLIANQDMQSLKEMENIAYQAAEQNDDQQIYELYLRLKNKVLQKFQRQDDPIVKNLESKAKIIQSSTQNIPRKPTYSKFKQYASDASPNVKQSMDSEIPKLATPRPVNWSRIPINEEDSDKISDPLGSPHHNSQGSNKSQRQEFIRQQQIIEHKITYRKYQLACILFNYSIKKSQSTFLNESVTMFNSIMDDLQSLPDTYSVKYMKINILTKKAFCYARAGMIDKARYELQDAITTYKDLEKNKEIQQLDIIDFVDIFRDIPLDILNEKISGLEALLLMIQGDYVESSLKFVQILQSQGPYDPGQHKFVMQTLFRIFKHCGANTDCLFKFQQQNQQKKLEIIFLLDYSGEMTAEQFTLSHSMCRYVIKQLGDDSNIGLYAFNESIYEIFPLQLKNTYKGLIEKSIEQLLVVPGGIGNIFSALEIAIAYLFDKGKVDLQKQLQKHIHSNKLKELFYEQEDGRFSLPDFHTKQLSSPKHSKGNMENFTQMLGEAESRSINENMNQFGVNIETVAEDTDEQSVRYICIFSEGVHNYNKMAIDRIASLIQLKNVHLLIFNIANQNMNMLYLRQLAEVSRESRFFTNENEMIDFFEKIKNVQFHKRIYLEFF